MITASDCLRIYKICPDNNSEKMVAEGFLKVDKKKPSPVTSFDWSPLSLNVIASASFDTLVTIWDLNQQELSSQFAGHDRAVNDISFQCNDSNVFVTCSSDGTLRRFDRRAMDHSDQLFKSEAGAPLLRCQYSHTDQNYIAILEDESKDVCILDTRKTDKPILLQKHKDVVNSFAWSPSLGTVLLTAAEDGSCYVWDINAKDQKQGKATMGYECKSPLQADVKEPACCCDWSGLNKEWCSVVHEKTLEMLHI